MSEHLERMDKRRVAITGLGLVTPIGCGKDLFWQAAREGRSGVREITRFDASPFRTRIGGECLDFDPLEFIDIKELDRMDRVAHLAIGAATLAIRDSSLKPEPATGVVLGTGLGGITTDDEQHELLHSKGPRFVKPMSIPMIMYNAAATGISMRFGLKGPGFTISTACASGAQAIGEAYRLIRHGYADCMVAGGADAPLSYGVFSGWCALRVLSSRNDDPGRASRPFSKDRDGMVLSEGAGIVVLEELERALRRGAPIYGELAGYGTNCDAHHLTHPDLDEEARAMELALRDASLDAGEIDYINAHGTATIVNDSVETRSIKRVFGERAYSIPVSSTKSMIGHAMGASGAIELITCALGITHGVVPPTINYSVPDPECDLDYVTDGARDKALSAVMSNSFGFGGTNAVLILKKLS